MPDNEAEIIAEIKSHGNITTRHLLRRLLECNIEKYRLRNDTDTGEFCTRNQGVIQVFKRLLMEIEIEEENNA